MSVKVLVGCYTMLENEQGLHLLDFDEENRDLTLINSHVVKNSSFAVYTSSKSVIYTVNENHTSSDSLTALSFDKENLTFETINDIEIEGSDPCFICVDSKLRHIFSANYSDGTVSCVSLKKDGSLGKLVQLIKHEVDPLDKLHPNTHMHAVVLSPCEKFLLVSNLGKDTITVYSYDPNQEQPLDQTNVVYQLPTGTGPRHLVFDQNSKFIYVVGELDASLHVLTWLNGRLTFVQQIMMMPNDFDGKNSAADLHFGLDGRFLYVSNRGDSNQIICFEINQITGHAKVNYRVSTVGIGPRNFAIDKTGEFMIIANQHSYDIRLFKIDTIDGRIYDTGKYYKLENPVYVSFLD